MVQECFYKENRRNREERGLRLSGRFGAEEWRLRPMSQRENEEIWLRCGRDESRYEAAMLAESVCFPDLKDVGLQNSYGVAGADRLLTRLLLPGRMYSFVQTEGEFHEPEYFLNLFREYKAAGKPVQLIVFRKLADGSQIFCGNIEVLLEDYTVTEKGGEQGDFWVELRWKEYRNAKSIRYEMKKEADGQTALIEQGQARESKTPEGSYTVRSGDCLWAIAKRVLGDGTRYREIAEKNGIADPNRIYPGQVLKL